MTSLPSRRTLALIGFAALLVIGLVWGFRSPPLLVDSAEVVRGTFRVTIDEEGRTRVADRYVVSAPVPGQLARVRLEPGDSVGRGDTLFAIHPAYTVPLDARSRAQAEASLKRAESSLESARTLVEAEQARAEHAESEWRRLSRLAEQGHASSDAVERAETERRRSAASLRSARFGVDVARHERDSAQAVLAIHGDGESAEAMPVAAPVSGSVLRRERQSEGAVQAGEPILELGSLDSLEVEVDVLSPDAVRLRPGMAVELERWGGEQTLPARVRRVEPGGFTKISALGVEEQRVWVIVDFEQPREAGQALGDGFRVEARFILWQGDDVLQVPASALFREGERWGVYVVENRRARHREVTPGRSSGLYREIREGLEAGEEVVVHPGQAMHDGARLQVR